MPEDRINAKPYQPQHEADRAANAGKRGARDDQLAH